MYNQTYEARQGRGPALEMVKAGHLAKRFRGNLMIAIHTIPSGYRPHVYGPSQESYRIASSNQKFLVNKLMQFKVYVLDYYPDEAIVTDVNGALSFIISLLKDAPAEGVAESVINFCDFILQDPKAGEVGDAIARVFRDNPSAYKVVETQNAKGETIRLIWPSSGEMSAKVLGEAINHIDTSDVKGVPTLLLQGRNRLIDRDYAGVVWEGYAAVEYAAEQVAFQRTGKSVKGLGKAVSAIIRSGTLDPFQEDILNTIDSKFSKYANPKRHPKGSLAIGSDEAFFFFGMCAMAAEYLASKLTEQPRGRHPNGKPELPKPDPVQGR